MSARQRHIEDNARRLILGQTMAPAPARTPIGTYVLAFVVTVSLLALLYVVTSNEKDAAVRLRQEKTGQVCHAKDNPGMDRGYEIICGNH